MNKNLFIFAAIALIFVSTTAVQAQTETSKYDNGQTEYTIQYDENGLEHGEWKYYYENGQVEMIETYNHGWPAGLWATYFDNGQIEFKEYYDNQGYETGIWESYFESGQLYYKGEYNNGKPIKEWKMFFEDGTLQASLSFTDAGKPTGEFTANLKNGKALASGSYNNGQKNGIWKTYYSNGKPKAEIVYSNGKIQKVNSAFNEEGAAVTYNKVIEGPLQGQWYDADDNKIQEVEFYHVFIMLDFDE